MTYHDHLIVGAVREPPLRLILLTGLLIFAPACEQPTLPASPSPTPMSQVDPTAHPELVEGPPPSSPSELGEPPACVGDGAFHVARGYQATPFLAGLGNLTSLAFGPNDHLYVADLGGNITAAEDANHDGIADRHWTYASGFASPLGIAFLGPDLYVSSHNRITVLRDRNVDAVADESQVIIPDLHATGQHQNNGIAFGPDGRLYITHGAATNDQPPAHPYEAAILQAKPDGSDLRVYATGLRNPYDLAFDQKGRLFATDNGIDSDANPFIPDELNLIGEGGFYGFPWISGMPTPAHQAERSSQPPVALLPDHASADGLAFYYADPSSPLHGDLFIAYWGPAFEPDYKCSPNTSRLVRVQFQEGPQGLETTVTDFAFGFRNALDVAVGPDGALYVADYAGTVYRIATE